jgi:hypothetical protein
MRSTTIAVVVSIVSILAYMGSLGYAKLATLNPQNSMLSPDTAGEFGPLLPNNINPHFMASGNCDGCHGYDPTGHASVDAEGHDISPITAWRATMMANSGKDPFFRAKMSHESTMNPSHQAALEDKCTSCHAPLGRLVITWQASDLMGFLICLMTPLDKMACRAWDAINRPQNIWAPIIRANCTTTIRW